jgi:hypothetical protein
MRRFLALLTAAFLVYSAAGCRHVAGACDCEHAINPSYNASVSSHGGNGAACGCGVTAPASPAVPPSAPAPIPVPVAR